MKRVKPRIARREADVSGLINRAIGCSTGSADYPEASRCRSDIFLARTTGETPRKKTILLLWERLAAIDLLPGRRRGQ
jgi:hypothetical protein